MLYLYIYIYMLYLFIYIYILQDVVEARGIYTQRNWIGVEAVLSGWISKGNHPRWRQECFSKFRQVSYVEPDFVWWCTHRLLYIQMVIFYSHGINVQRVYVSKWLISWWRWRSTSGFRSVHNFRKWEYHPNIPIDLLPKRWSSPISIAMTPKIPRVPWLPSGKLSHHHGKSPLLMGIATITGHFLSLFVGVPEGPSINPGSPRRSWAATWRPRWPGSPALTAGPSSNTTWAPARRCCGRRTTCNAWRSRWDPGLLKDHGEDETTKTEVGG